MKETELLDAVGSALDPPSGPSKTLRQRVVTGFVAAEFQPVSSPRRHRPAAWAAVVAAAALLVVGGAVAANWQPADHGAVAAGPTSPTGLPNNADPTVTTPLTGPPDVQARTFLRAAATAARTNPTPRPDQFIHIESISVRNGNAHPGDTWRSVDGTQAGHSDVPVPLTIAGCKDGRAVGEDGEPLDPDRFGARPCSPQPGFRVDLPTTLAGMRQLLHTKGLLDLMLSVFMVPTPTVLPAETEAVLFEALAELPEVSLVQPVTDAAGRQGVAVSWDDHGSTLRLVFNPANHTYRSIQIIDPGKRVPSMEDTIVGWEIVDTIPAAPARSPIRPTTK